MTGEKILVVDDEENFRSLFSKTLEKAGYHVKTAENGADAFHLLRQENFELGLIDLKMAPVDGFTILEKIKKEYPRLKVIIVSAYSTPEFQARSLQMGADAFLVKPIEISELKETIQSILSR